jgi:hypothetical protein
MMADFNTKPGNRSASEIEREVDEERARLSDTLDALQEKASIGNIVDQVVRAIGENGGEVSRNLGRTLRDNPLPALLTGVGLAWLMAGNGKTIGRQWDSGDDDDYRGDDYDSARDYYPGDQAGSADGGQGEENDSSDMWQRAAEVGSEVRERAAKAGAGFAERASEFRHDAEQRLASTGGAMRDASDAARRSAGRARRRAALAGHDAREGLDTLMTEQPLVLGALALAVGAAIGGALPRSRNEDRLFGARSDRTKRSIRTLAEQEGRKVSATAAAVADEALSIADETIEGARESLPGGREMVDKVDAKIEDAATRLRKAGEREAERQHLGHTDQPSE